MLAHHFAGALPILKQPWIGDFAFELGETFAFPFDDQIEVHKQKTAIPGRSRDHGGKQNQLSFLADARGFGAAVTARELLDATRCIDEFLFAGEKRMTSGANTDSNVATGRAGVIDRTARASDICLVIFWVNACFHRQK